MQDYEPLIGRIGMTAFASRRTAFPVDDILVPIKRLRSPDYVLMENRLLRGTVGRELWRRIGLDYMVGLEQAVAGFDVLHGCETNTGYTYQLARVRQRRPRVRLVSTCWETIPFWSSSSLPSESANATCRARSTCSWP